MLHLEKYVSDVYNFKDIFYLKKLKIALVP